MKEALPGLRPFTVTFFLLLFTVTFTIFFSDFDNPETFVAVLVNVLLTPKTFVVAASAVIGAVIEKKMAEMAEKWGF